MNRIETFDSLVDTSQSTTASEQAILNALEQTLVQEQDFHRLFDAKMIRVRRAMGLPIVQPTSLQDIPKEQEAEFRDSYINAAREVGTAFLNAGKLADAWAYFRTIHEPEPVRQAIEKIQIPREPDEKFDEIMNLALYEGAHVVRGLEFLLKTHGTCNTVTAMSQLLAQMAPEERRQAAAMMVRNLYDDVQLNVKRNIESRQPVLNPHATLIELITGREWLFEDGNYHIDVSHLHSTVAFARHLQNGDPELRLAIELAAYGSKLGEQLRYPGDIPFDDYYTAHLHFLNALAGQNVDQAIDYFVGRMDADPDLADKQMIAFVIMDLANRVGRVDKALEKAGEFVSRMEDPSGFSFTAFCVEHGRSDLLEAAARKNDDVLGLVTALLLQNTRK